MMCVMSSVNCLPFSGECQTELLSVLSAPRKGGDWRTGEGGVWAEEEEAVRSGVRGTVAARVGLWSTDTGSLALGTDGCQGSIIASVRWGKHGNERKIINIRISRERVGADMVINWNKNDYSTNMFLIE